MCSLSGRAGAQHSQSPMKATGWAVIDTTLGLNRVQRYLKSTQESGQVALSAA